MTTIRKNAHRKINEILTRAVLIRQYHDDGYSAHQDRPETVTPQDVIAAGERFDFSRINTNDGVTNFTIHANWFFIAYDSEEVARRHLVPQAFAKYFPAVAA